MTVDTILSNDEAARDAALADAVAAPEYKRSALASRLATVAKEAAATLAITNEGEDAPLSGVLDRACRALSMMRVGIAKNCLLRIADEGTTAVKTLLAKSLRGTTTADGRAVLVYLLSDDDARTEAIVSIGTSPWPDALPLLIEMAEADESDAAVTMKAIARCGASASAKESDAAADFLLQALDDETHFEAALDALLILGNAIDVKVARAFLLPRRKDADERIRRAAERTWKALDLR